MFIFHDRSWTMFGLCLRIWINGCEKILLPKQFGTNNKRSFFYVIPTKNLLVVFLFKRTQFLKFNSLINLYFFGSPRNERSTYIKYFNCYWSTKSPHYRAALYTLIFVYSKRISYLVFVISVMSSCCFDKDILLLHYS